MPKKALVIVAVSLWVIVGAGRLWAAPTIIARGATGPAVKDVQKALNSIGIPAGPADGVFGPSTEKAVKILQATKKIPVDGVVGPRTNAVIQAELKAAEKRNAEKRRLEEKRVYLEQLKKRTLEARKSPGGGSLQPTAPLLAAAGERGVIYLTFDDGPDPAITPQILDILKKSGVRATFFVIGRRAEQYPDLVRRMMDEGHSIQNHSYSHDQKPPASVEAIEADIARAARVIEGITGTSTRYYRPPYGNTSPAILEAARNQGHTVTLWSNIWGNGPSAAISAAFDGSIIMLKEDPETLRFLQGIVDGLEGAGYRFSPIEPVAAAFPSG